MFWIYDKLFLLYPENNKIMNMQVTSCSGKWNVEYVDKAINIENVLHQSIILNHTPLTLPRRKKEWMNK